MTSFLEQPALLETFRSLAPPALPADSQVASLARVLATTKLGATALHVAGRGAELALWLHAGLDTSARLICLAPTGYLSDALRGVFDADIRVSVSCQDTMTFVEDVTPAHCFDLIVFEGQANAAGLARLAHSLCDGGILLIDNADTATRRATLDQLDPTRFAAADSSPNAPWILTKSPSKPRGRKGGRAARDRASS